MKRIALVLVISMVGILGKAQNLTVAFYNTENLMDTEDNPRALDNDFLPGGKYKWDLDRYKKKLTSLAKVISDLGDSDGPELLGLAEVENKKVLQDLVKEPSISNRKYSIVHFDSPDERGIDVALLYKPARFKFVSAKAHSAAFLKIKSHTRDVLLVKGCVGKDTLIVLVNHWPSRRSGKEASENKRIAISIMVRELVDSIQLKSPSSKIILMGDFNDEPTDKSIAIELNAKKESANLTKGQLYNPFWAMQAKGEGSVNYSHQWDMFDQVLVSSNLITTKAGVVFKSASVYHPLWMHYKNDPKAGPYRTFMGDGYKGGYSDHFPVFVVLAVK